MAMRQPNDNSPELLSTRQTDAPAIPFGEAFKVWVRVAIFSFGGPAGQIAVMHSILVDEKRWVSERRFLHALNYCMLLPGPEAQQLATYIGWLLHKTRGGLVAGTLFVLPGFISILLLSILYATFQDMTLVQGLFLGLKPAVMAVVVEAVLRMGRRILKNAVMVGLATLSFVAIFFFNVSFPIIVLAAGLIGYVGGKFWLDKFDVIQGHKGADQGSTVISDDGVVQGHPSVLRSIKVLTIGLTLWFGPLLLLLSVVGRDNVFVEISLFFSTAAVITFGGAYAVLGYIAQEAVAVYGWLRPGEMLDGLGMAETTPGPLIQVVQFVGFMGAYRQPAELSPLLAGILGSILTTWVTFVPCFIWIFLGAPYIEALRGNRSLTTALSAITAAVIGVILNLAVWFSLHTLFGQVNEIYLGALRLQLPVWATLNVASLVIALGAFTALFRLKQNMLVTLGGSALAGLIYSLIVSL